MGYYMAGDYYLGGDYYAAGGFFGSIGRVLGGVAKIAGGIVPGPVGTILRTGGGILSGRPRTSVAPATGAPAIAFPGGVGPPMGRAAPGPRASGAPAAAVGAACPAGYHLNKSDYWFSGGFVPKGSKCVRNRRMNPGNSRALGKSLRRQGAFIRLARRSGLVTLPKSTRVRKAARGKRK